MSSTVCDLELKDTRLFTGAVESIRDRAEPVVRRAKAVAQGLPALTALIES
jgi:hypothetical protein